MDFPWRTVSLQEGNFLLGAGLFSGGRWRCESMDVGLALGGFVDDIDVFWCGKFMGMTHWSFWKILQLMSGISSENRICYTLFK